MSDFTSLSTCLTINRLSRKKYNELSAAGQLHSDQIYQIIDKRLNASGLRIINTATPVISSDATNKLYVDSNLSNRLTKEQFGLEYNSTDSQLRLSVADNVLTAEIQSGSGGSDVKLCAYVEDLEKDIYGQDRDRRLLTIDEFNKVEQVLSVANEELHLGYDLQTVDTYEKMNQVVMSAYEVLDLVYVEPADLEALLVQINEIASSEQLKYKFTSTIKAYIQDLNERLKKFERFDIMLLSGEYEDGGEYQFNILTSSVL